MGYPAEPASLMRDWLVIRHAGQLHRPIEAGGLTLDPAARFASWRGRFLALTSIEFDILRMLVGSAGRTVTRNAICQELHKRPFGPHERSIDVHVSHLRKKLSVAREVRIRSIRGEGYRLIIAGEAAA